MVAQDFETAEKHVEFLVELLAPGGKPDLPRNSQLTALLGDPLRGDRLHEEREQHASHGGGISGSEAAGGVANRA